MCKLPFRIAFVFAFIYLHFSKLPLVGGHAGAHLNVMDAICVGVVDVVVS